jgi:hypothetical protein
MAIPDEVFAAVRLVMQRKDFAAIEWALPERRWFVGLYNGRTGEGGKKLITWYAAERLSQALAPAAGATT